jgi:hypothetical protein
MMTTRRTLAHCDLPNALDHYLAIVLVALEDTGAVNPRFATWMLNKQDVERGFSGTFEGHYFGEGQELEARRNYAERCNKHMAAFAA